MELSDKPISPARQRLNVPRHIRLIPQRLPLLLDRGIHAMIEIDKCVRRPEPLPQLVARNKLSGMFQQNFKNLNRLPLQLQPDTTFAELSAPRVELEGAKAVGLLLAHGHRSPPGKAKI